MLANATTRELFLHMIRIAIAWSIGATGSIAGTMNAVSTLCHDRSRNGHEIRAVLEATGWRQAVVDRYGLYSDLATSFVLEITDPATTIEHRYAQAPALAGNFEQMVLSGAARIYQKNGAILFWAARNLPEDGEQVTCILGIRRDPETLMLMDQNGGAELDPLTQRVSRRVIEEGGSGRRSMRLWARLMDVPPRTPLTDLFYLERLTPRE